MKHRLNILRLCILLLAGVMLSGCAKDTDSGTSNDGMTEITFTVATATDKPGTTRIGEAAVPKGTAFCVVIYKAGEAPATATPVATGIYSTIDDTGTASAQTAADRILLYSGSYDFYFVAPTAAPIAGTVTVQNGDEVLTTGKQTINVQPDADGKCPISILFARRSSMLDIVVYYKTDDGPTTSVTISADKTLLVSGLFASADVLLDGSAVTSTGTTGTGTLTGDKLKETTEPAGVNTKGFSTFTDGTHRGLHVLPGTTDLGVVVPVTINGSVSRNMQAEIAHVKLEEGKYYTLKVQVSLTAPVVATIEEWIPSTGNGEEMPGAIDQTLRPANCYIVYGNNRTVIFDATKKPRTATGAACSNPSTVEIDKALSNDLNKGDIASVKVVWQTAINHSSPASGTKADMILQHISYNAATGICRVTSHAIGYGNAVIAAYDSNDKILWNWHIWVTEGKVQANVNTGNTSLNGGGKFMDRNLGALATTTSQPAAADAYKYFGMYYQHGRPTPFAGQGEGTAADTYTKLYKGDGTEIKEGVGGYAQSNTAVSSVTEAVETPDTYYFLQYPPYWNWISVNLALWSDSGVNKSIYDPCPYGYRVPINGSYNGFTTATFTTESIHNGSTWNGSWWPIAGRRGYSGGSILTVGNTAFYWMSTYYAVNTSYYLYFDYGGVIKSSNDYSRSAGFPVRCVQDK